MHGRGYISYKIGKDCGHKESQIRIHGQKPKLVARYRFVNPSS